MMRRDAASYTAQPKSIRVLVVDDSAFMRYLIAKQITADGSIEVAASARDGIDALEKIAQYKPDVVTLDLEMPRMDGLTALEQIMKENPVPVILLSTLTQEGAAVTIKGLELGAVDFVTKPSVVQAASADSTWAQLVEKIKAASGLNLRQLRFRMSFRHIVDAKSSSSSTPARPHQKKPTKVVVIGTSTGGPRALFEVVPHLPANLPVGILIVQHMPPGFTRSLANRLNEVSSLEVREAVDGDTLEIGTALLAPGDFHMIVRQGGRITLEKSPPLHGVRPAVDITMQSAASIYGASVVGVIMTGMGTDGTNGAIAIKRFGGFVLSEDEATCVVYGMPRSVREAGATNKVVRLEEMANAIVEAVSLIK